MKDLLCARCHAELAAASGASACPACGGKLVLVLDQPGPDGDAAHQLVDAPVLPPRETDHRGILLPRRHAVGGIITPR